MSTTEQYRVQRRSQEDCEHRLGAAAGAFCLSRIRALDTLGSHPQACCCVHHQTTCVQPVWVSVIISIETSHAARYHDSVVFATCVGCHQVIVQPAGDTGELPKTFTFDNVFDWNSTQTSVYNETAKPIVDSVLEGYNGTVFAYGQTGTGKTHTMDGGAGDSERGIIPKTFDQIFEAIQAWHHSSQHKHALVCDIITTLWLSV